MPKQRATPTELRELATQLSDASVAIYDGGGWFRFNSINDTTINIQYYGIAHVKASGDQGNAFRHIPSGNSIPVDATDDIFIQWDMVLAPSVPIMFIFGVIGLMGCFGGPLYMVHTVKKGNYYEGFRIGLIVTGIGIAFLLAWLW